MENDDRDCYEFPDQYSRLGPGRNFFSLSPSSPPISHVNVPITMQCMYTCVIISILLQLCFMSSQRFSFWGISGKCPNFESCQGYSLLVIISWKTNGFEITEETLCFHVKEINNGRKFVKNTWSWIQLAELVLLFNGVVFITLYHLL